MLAPGTELMPPSPLNRLRIGFAAIGVLSLALALDALLALSVVPMSIWVVPASTGS